VAEFSVAIIGSGIIGTSTALALQSDGHQVILLDRDGPCAGASFGNAGAIVNGSCVPTAMPGIVLDAIQMIARASSPLSIKPAYLLHAIPWFTRFLLESRQAKVLQNAINLHALTRHAAEGWRQLTNNTSLSQLLSESGWLKVYETHRSFEGTAAARKLMDEIGTRYEILDASQIQDLEPKLAPVFNYGIFQSDSLRIVNPQRVVQGMVDLLVSRGGTYKQFDANSIDIVHKGSAGEKVRIKNSQAELITDKVVIAAGAWSRPLVKQMGDDVPLDTERGYHLMLPVENSELLSRPVVNGESSFVLSPMENGLRMTSQVEFAGLKAAPDYRTVRSLLPKAKRMLPELQAREESVWLGFRPSLPDSLPVLGFSSNSDRVLYAFGHQHLGMTLGPITGILVSDLISGREPRVNMAPYQAQRF
jgi:glycine/D-amino acid oxidase-like deaminating enzyme